LLAGLLLVLLAASGTGCKSIYKQTRSDLPPEPAAELRLRVAEARHAEGQVQQSGQKLQRDLKHTLDVNSIRIDFDRIEAAAYELERRVQAGREALGRQAGANEFAKEIEFLQQQAAAWQDFVTANRHTAAAIQARQLAPLLRDSASK
jgi:hypothetical protein